MPLNWRERAQPWTFEDALRLLKSQTLSAEQQRLADHCLVELGYCRQAMDTNLRLIEELQGPGEEKTRA